MPKRPIPPPIPDSPEPELLDPKSLPEIVLETVLLTGLLGLVSPCMALLTALIFPNWEVAWWIVGIATVVPVLRFGIRYFQGENRTRLEDLECRRRNRERF